jgi:hypothetical protein
MSAAIKTVEFDHSRLGAKELILLSKLQLGMQFRTPVLIQAEISKQEWQKQGVALLVIGFLFAVLGYLCFQDIEDMYSAARWAIYLLLAAFLYALSTQLPKENATTQIIRKRSQEELVSEVQKARDVLKHNPFLHRQGFTLYENLPKIYRLGDYHTRCQKELHFLNERIQHLQIQLEQMEQLRNKIPNFNAAQLEQMELKLGVYSEMFILTKDYYQRLTVLINKTDLERDRLRTLAERDSLREDLRPEKEFERNYNSSMLMEPQNTETFDMEREFSQLIANINNINGIWRRLIEERTLARERAEEEAAAEAAAKAAAEAAEEEEAS